MAIYLFFGPPRRPTIKTAIKTAIKTLIASAAIISTTILTAGCSDRTLGLTNGTARLEETSTSQAGTLAKASDRATNSATAATDKPQNGVSTNYDIYHSKALEVPAGKPVPAITVRVDPDDARGWNLYVGTANFSFTPENVGGESNPFEGHAQLYINEKPMQRIYSSWTHLPTLPPGTNEIRVTLNANGYETLTTQNMPIEDTATVKVYDPKAATN
ncbi:MAG: hypothetical protein WBA76_21420 [Phormidesmis sp.]